VRALESSATAEVHRGWNRHQMEQVSRGNCQLNQDPVPPAHLLPELRPKLLPPKKRKSVIKVVARATERGADSSVSPGAPRQRRVRHETRRCPSADPAPWLHARHHVLLRDLHLAHHHQRPAGHHRACRSPTWGSPTRRLLEALLPSISTSVLRALQRAQQLPAKLRNRLGSSRFGYPGTAQIAVSGGIAPAHS